MSSKKGRPKPRLTLVRGSDAGRADVLAQLFKQLTGRVPTAQEIEDAKKKHGLQ